MPCLHVLWARKAAGRGKAAGGVFATWPFVYTNQSV